MVRHATMRGTSELHTLLETVSTLLALTAGGMALIRYYAQPTAKFLFLGNGFLVAGVLDGYHAAITSSFLAEYSRSSTSALVAWSGVASRILLALLICAGMVAWRKEARRTDAKRIRQSVIYLGSGVCTLACILVLWRAPLPPAYYANLPVHRPAELIAGFFFGLASLGHLRNSRSKIEEFDCWLVLSLLVAAAGHLAYMAFSGALFDALYISAHVLKVLSYVSVLAGLFLSMLSVYRREADGAIRLLETNQSLQGEIAEREQIEESFYEMHCELEMRVKTRTSDLSAANRALEMEIAERRRAEETLRDSEERFRLITETITEVFWMTDQGLTTMIYVSPAYERVWGRSQRSLYEAPESFLEAVHPDDFKQTVQYIQSRMGGQQPLDHEYRILTVDGSTRWIWNRGFPVFDSEHDIRFYVGVALDVTGRRQLEQQLLQSQKLESIGRLAAGIAHEINTPIQYIGDNGGFLQEAFRDLMKAVNPATPDNEQESDLEYLTEEIPKSIAQLLDGVGRVSGIVRAMKEFAHPDCSDKKATDLNSCLESTVLVARNEIKYVADVETDFGEMPAVFCHAGDLNQVFLNLLINAAHAIGDAVTIDQPRGLIQVRTRQDGEHVVISISDTGGGIPEAIRGKIFEPFFTTKAVGRGTGQGLSIARSIVVDKHGGTLSFDTEVGRTTFYIRLPIGLGSEAQLDPV
jgi:PAS domain S-box-containing protein